MPRISFETRVLTLALAAALPGSAIALALLVIEGYSGKVVWTFAIIVIGSWLGFALPLRDRGEDIAALAAHFLKRQGARYGTKKLTGLDREALRAMHEHPWPGNIRELEHTIERAVLMAAGPQIRPDDLGLRTRSDGTARLEDMTLEEAEKHLIRKALGRCQGNVSRAAEALGLSRSALYRRLQQYDIPE